MSVFEEKNKTKQNNFSATSFVEAQERNKDLCTTLNCHNFHSHPKILCCSNQRSDRHSIGFSNFRQSRKLGKNAILKIMVSRTTITMPLHLNLMIVKVSSKPNKCMDLWLVELGVKAISYVKPAVEHQFIGNRTISS